MDCGRTIGFKLNELTFAPFKRRTRAPSNGSSECCGIFNNLITTCGNNGTTQYTRKKTGIE